MLRTLGWLLCIGSLAACQVACSSYPQGHVPAWEAAEEPVSGPASQAEDPADGSGSEVADPAAQRAENEAQDASVRPQSGDGSEAGGPAGGSGEETDGPAGGKGEETDGPVSAKGEETPGTDGGNGDDSEGSIGGNAEETDGSASGKGDETDAKDTDAAWETPAVRGIYVTGPRAGSEGMADLIALCDTTELNAMVIDLKNDSGEITFKVDPELTGGVQSGKNYIRDLSALLQTLHEHEIYVIARIVCFKDAVLPAARPDLQLLQADGTPVTDGKGLTWVNPCSEEVWDYLIGIGCMAADLGFDEVQFDYVRFPSGKSARVADYGRELDDAGRQQVISDFLSKARAAFHEKGIPFSADLFGTVIGNAVDAGIVGQNYAAVGSRVDAISPMVYPSHYGPGVFGFAVPDANPYGTVSGAMQRSLKELGEVPEKQRAAVRPWLQAFTATWLDGHISYGGDQIREQIRAVYDAGYDQWILWNAANHYSADGLYLPDGTPPEPVEAPPESDETPPEQVEMPQEAVETMDSSSM